MSDYTAALARIEAAIYAVWPLNVITEEATSRAKKDVLEAIQSMKYSTGQERKYIDTYPHLVKWINQCIQCQAQGHQPYLPARL